eukprot:TRINITY_DN7260_c0_g1_i1.p1 TRINITY_DN7260_c0_g1~~TRINITY_DN7260_c0_g1_i1.p1  ORF type:complete len:62 (+),score=12.50 TRINITY_DN7260_c0_g1_i1:97-282(+)
MNISAKSKRGPPTLSKYISMPPFPTIFLNSVANLRLYNSKPPHVLCVDTGRSSETAKAHRG